MRAFAAVAVVVAALVVPSLCAANPAPSMVGPTGLITVPDTQTVGASAVDVGVHFFSEETFSELMIERQYPEPFDLDTRIWHANIGLCDKVEISVAMSVVEGGGMDLEDTTFGVKWAPLQEPDDCVGLALGVYNAGAEQKDTSGITAFIPDSQDGAIWYGVLSKSITNMKEGKRPIRILAGIELADDAWGPGYIKARALGGIHSVTKGDYGDECPNFFMGLDADLADWVSIIADTNEFDDFNFGARVNVTPELSIDLIGLDFWGRDNRFAAGAGYHCTW